MMILSVASSFHRKGYLIIRPRDRSCWILRDPSGRDNRQYWTRADAIAAADSMAAPDAARSAQQPQPKLYR